MQGGTGGRRAGAYDFYEEGDIFLKYVETTGCIYRIS